MNVNDYSLWTALVTPLTPGLEVDYLSLKALVKEQDEAGNGILILGSTGEALNLSLEMRQNIVDYVISLSPKSPLMVGVGAHDLPSQRSWCQWLETKNIHAYLMCTPIYAKPGDEGQFEWFKVLMDDVSRPVMLYNVPGRAAKELSLKAVEKLNNHQNFWAIKAASGSVSKMKGYLSVAGSGKVYCGDDALLPSFVNAGAVGLVSVASNTWPKETNLYVKKALTNKLTADSPWEAASNSLFIASNPVPAKALLAMEGRIAHDTMMPPLSRRDLTNLRILKTSSTNIRDWYNKNK